MNANAYRQLLPSGAPPVMTDPPDRPDPPASLGWGERVGESGPFLFFGGASLVVATLLYMGGLHIGRGPPLWALFAILGSVSVTGGLVGAWAEGEEDVPRDAGDSQGYVSVPRAEWETLQRELSQRSQFRQEVPAPKPGPGEFPGLSAEGLSPLGESSPALDDVDELLLQIEDMSRNLREQEREGPPSLKSPELVSFEDPSPGGGPTALELASPGKARQIYDEESYDDLDLQLDVVINILNTLSNRQLKDPRRGRGGSPSP